MRSMSRRKVQASSLAVGETAAYCARICRGDGSTTLWREMRDRHRCADDVKYSSSKTSISIVFVDFAVKPDPVAFNREHL
ncbi:hypothetical protein NPIL_35921 [Nephila pilipes]|uniref:Uncharacterized protein n=1 Tax=Nephila pilipes TaxID=299642 RepID=A0A8X6NGI8_NEPPI|nr:hypothetical protein NPIL_35921 [Nephila pilipes]